MLVCACEDCLHKSSVQATSSSTLSNSATIARRSGGYVPHLNLLQDDTVAMTSILSRTETWSLLTLLGASLTVITNTFQGDGEPLVASLAFSCLAFTLTYAFVRWAGPAFIKAGLKGKDMSKHNAAVL